MAGIYVHVPFCKVKCHYCDFHFSTQLKHRKALIEAIQLELEFRKSYLEEEPLKTVYFGGGTPTVIESHLLEDVMNTIAKNYAFINEPEITVECNPDDITPEKLSELKSFGVNRLSIGVQSFFNDTLQFMNRAHNASEAKTAIKMVQDCGIDNITIDLIYGVPGTDLLRWKEELNQMVELGVPHLSAYCLTIEENTVFGARHKKGELKTFPDTESLKQFDYLIDFAAQHGLEQYEISNFSKPGYISQHNSAYWLGETYLGVGPAAHSYNGKSRGWNVANNPQYIQRVTHKKDCHSTENLSQSDRFNEYILTRLRTKWGIDLNDLKGISTEMTKAIQPDLAKYIQSNELQKTGTVFTLTRSGKFIADAISADLFQ